MGTYKTKKSKQLHQKLINEVKDTMRSDLYNYEDFIFDLVGEALQKRTIKDLAEILGLNENEV